jgi:hypothetical protein
MSTWRCGWICPRSYFFAAVFLVGASSRYQTVATTNCRPADTRPLIATPCL